MAVRCGLLSPDLRLVGYAMVGSINRLDFGKLFRAFDIYGQPYSRNNSLGTNSNGGSTGHIIKHHSTPTIA